MTNAHTPTRRRRPKDECARLGKEIYDRDIKPLVKDDHDGEYVSIDLDSGNWAVGDSLLASADRLRERRPDAVDVWIERVGYRAAGSWGGGARWRAR